MIYVIGDIHGDKEKFDSMMEKLSPTDNDTVFVLGDIINIGDSSIELLQDMMYRPNVYPVLGEHEYMAKKVFPLLAEFSSADEAHEKLQGENKELFEKWLKMKSEKTTEDFLSLDEEGKESIIDYLSEFEPFEEISAGGKSFVLCHAGINNFEEDKDLSEYDEEDFVFAKTDYSTIYFADRYLVTGHTPTAVIDRSLTGKVYSKKRHLAIDCGCGYGGRLAAVCLDKLKVYYV
ncbi:MAG: metallophosphoesterase [Clostridia bacterium]|nr:metallophosphoesterase [Clostridia bacterium]MBQ1996255.1 metallophosphoesterase [Clostridia bacterium]